MIWAEASAHFLKSRIETAFFLFFFIIRYGYRCLLKQARPDLRRKRQPAAHLWSVVCGLVYVVCGMWYVVCGMRAVMWYAVCGMWYAVCGRRGCDKHDALGSATKSVSNVTRIKLLIDSSCKCLAASAADPALNPTLNPGPYCKINIFDQK